MTTLQVTREPHTHIHVHKHTHPHTKHKHNHNKQRGGQIAYKRAVSTAPWNSESTKEYDTNTTRQFDRKSTVHSYDSRKRGCSKHNPNREIGTTVADFCENLLKHVSVAGE